MSKPLPPEPFVNLGFLFEIPTGAIDQAIVEHVAGLGFGDVRSAHRHVFVHVAGEGSRITELARAAKMTKQSMQYLVDDLERLGYAERIADPADRRAKLVRLTPRGRSVVLAGRQAIAETERRWAERLGGRRMLELRRLLEDLVAEIGPGTTSG